ncbi:GTP cyclohydrolase II [Cryptotrichosporon argae]
MFDSRHSPSQGDLDVLSLLTSDAPPRPQQGRPGARKPQREQSLDALMISAVLAGSGPVTRHHFGHGIVRPGAYVDCDNSRPSSPSRSPVPSKVVMRSAQAPRSERLKAEADAVSALRSGPAAVSPAVSSAKTKQRRLSVDPAPVAHVLQLASPGHNFFHGPAAAAGPTASTSAAAASVSSSSSTSRAPTPTRPLVRCMARTRIPTPHGEVFLHLYHNSVDQKEHLAIVIDPIQLSPDARAQAPRGRGEIRSRTLEAKWRDGETDMERVVRGAYVGRLTHGSEGQASAARDPDGAQLAAEDARADAEPAANARDILPLVRIHSECFTGETIGSMRCDCGEQLDEALRLIAQPQSLAHGHAGAAPTGLLTPVSSRAPSPGTAAAATADAQAATPRVPGRGVVIYMRQEGRGIGLLEKIRAYNLQDLGHDTVTANLMLGHGADERTYAVAGEILRDLGLAGDERLGKGGIRLLTNNPEKVAGLAAEGIRIDERVGMVPRDWKCGSHTPADEEKEYNEWRTRRAGVGLIGAGAARGPELEKYLRTKVERMGHMIDIPGTL